MRDFARRPTADRAAYFGEAAANRGVPVWMLEKDFWVCWLLQQVFALPHLKDHLVFKGGTSLSKVFGVIERFSEDIDLSVSPNLLGFTEEGLDRATGRPFKDQCKKLEEACIEEIQGRTRTLLAAAITRELGSEETAGWSLAFEIDSHNRSPALLFQFPVSSVFGGYVPARVKLEFGSLTDQRPAGAHSVTPMIAEAHPKVFSATTAPVVALEVERTFWEKATILHAECHRDPSKVIPDRYARHYSDLAALARHELGARCLARTDLLATVAHYKSVYFASGWANYQTAKLGTLRLVPPEFRLPRLAEDYRLMRDMFLEKPPAFEAVMTTLQKLQDRINV